MVSVCYIVNDVEAAVGFRYPAPRIPGGDETGTGGAGEAMPGGWNRIQLAVDDLQALGVSLRNAGAHFRNDIVVGRGGRQIPLEDPSGNCIELFEPS
jgi:hypothetical protein